ncbi:hypothetical protein GGR52DRAFT_40515 [Hypoxylon sp. FL1284]|nr:hypothetical protein GGR52DRAFT_40515 [Hypoxylon sp. FL1284]
MTCSCRTAALRLFVQGFSELRLSGSATAPTPTWQFQPRYQHAATRHFSRPYSATAALSFSWQRSRQSAAESKVSDPAPEAEQQNEHEHPAPDQPSNDARQAEASTTDLNAPEHEGIVYSYQPLPIIELGDLENTDFGVEEETNSRPRSPRLLKKVERVGKNMTKGSGKQSQTKPRPPPKKEGWQVQKLALQKKFPEGWAPRKRLSPDALEGIRALHAQFPETYTTEVLAGKFAVSPEVIRRILRSHWTPTPAQEEDRQTRWFKRGKNIWTQLAALGRKPPRRWRREGIVRDPIWNEPRGPRTQPPKQRRPRNPSEDPKQRRPRNSSEDDFWAAWDRS